MFYSVNMPDGHWIWKNKGQRDQWLSAWWLQGNLWTTLSNYFWVFKEWGQSFSSQLSNKQFMPDQILHQIMSAVIMIIVLSHQNGVSCKMSPREIVSPRKMRFKKSLQSQIWGIYGGQHGWSYDKHLQGRTHECMGIGPIGKYQGSVACLNLDMGRVVAYTQLHLCLTGYLQRWWHRPDLGHKT